VILHFGVGLHTDAHLPVGGPPHPRDAAPPVGGPPPSWGMGRDADPPVEVGGPPGANREAAGARPCSPRGIRRPKASARFHARSLSL
jgi:hypothetical protein